MTTKASSPNKQNRGQGRRSDFPRLLSGHLCLDFVNSLDERHSAHPVEYLHSYADLVAWAEHVWLLDEAQIAGLRAMAEQDAQAAAAVFDAALELREALLRIFLAAIDGAAWSAEDEGHLQRAYLAAIQHAQLQRGQDGYRWSVGQGAIRLELVVWLVAQAAVELLCSAQIARVKECPGANDCGWLFLDTSKNGTRRWCSMESCGSRVKMRRQYARKREGS